MRETRPAFCRSIFTLRRISEGANPEAESAPQGRRRRSGSRRENSKNRGCTVPSRRRLGGRWPNQPSLYHLLLRAETLPIGMAGVVHAASSLAEVRRGAVDGTGVKGEPPGERRCHRGLELYLVDLPGCPAGATNRRWA